MVGTGAVDTDLIPVVFVPASISINNYASIVMVYEADGELLQELKTFWR